MRRAPLRPPLARRGAALVIVLWTALLLSVLAAGAVATARLEGRIAAARVQRLKADLALASALDVAAHEIAAGDPAAARRRTVVGVVDIGGVAVRVERLDADERLDVNHADETQWTNLLVAEGLARVEAEKLAARIADWKDEDDLRRPNGAERPDYAAAGLTIGDRGFRSVGEVRAVLGFPTRFEACRRLTLLSADSFAPTDGASAALGTEARGSAPGLRVGLVAMTESRASHPRSRVALARLGGASSAFVAYTIELPTGACREPSVEKTEEMVIKSE